jgi:uncharacterized protein YjbI with pentapeptide repeats
VAPPWPIPVVPLNAVACGSALWTTGAALRATVFVKATFTLLHGREAWPTAPADLVRSELQHDGDPRRSVELASETAPYLPSAGVVLTGHAHAPAGRSVPTMSVRLAVFREKPLLDKTIHVFGDRTAAQPSPRPFQTMPLVYERAYGGVGFDDNPIGVGAAPGATTLPNLVDPSDPRRPAGFGPLSQYSPRRRRLLGSTDRKRLDPPIATIPDGFDWKYFHGAPADQQVAFLRGDEWLILDGMHPSQARIQTRLPSARARARWHLVAGGRAGPPRDLDLSADTLAIDADRQTCAVIWRGHFTIENAEAAPWVRVFAGIELPGRAIVWPKLEDISVEPAPRSERAPAPAGPENKVLPGTATIGSAAQKAAAARPVTPFSPRLDGAPHVVPVIAAPFPGGMARAGARGGTQQLPPGSPDEKTGDMLPIIPGDALPFNRARPEASAAAAPREAPAPPKARGLSSTTGDMLPIIPAKALPFGEQQPGQEGARATTDAAKNVPPAPAAQPIATVARAAFAPTVALPAFAAPDQPAELAPRAPPPAVILGAPAMAPAIAPGAPAMAPAMVLGTPAMAPAMVLGTPAMAPAMVLGTPAMPPAIVPEPPAPAPTGEPPAGPASAPSPASATGRRAQVLAKLSAGDALHELDLSGADLSDLDFSGRALTGCNLRGAKLQRCLFKNARLAEAKLAGADLTEADFVGADLTRADLKRATLARARFDGATLVETVFEGAQGSCASFRGATGQRSIFARGAWEGATFKGMQMPGADFEGAVLEGASLEGASIPDISLAGATGGDVMLDRAQLPRARAQGASLTGSSLKNIEAPGSNWEKATLSGSVFDDANLRGANFTRATITKSRLTRAELAGANLQRVSGDGADLTGCNLEGADLRHARMHEASFAGATLTKVAGSRADFTSSRFVRADLGGAMFRPAKMKFVNLAHARVEGTDLRDVDLEGANLFGVVRENAKMAGANLRNIEETAPGAKS